MIKKFIYGLCLKHNFKVMPVIKMNLLFFISMQLLFMAVEYLIWQKFFIHIGDFILGSLLGIITIECIKCCDYVNNKVTLILWKELSPEVRTKILQNLKEVTNEVSF